MKTRKHVANNIVVKAWLTEPNITKAANTAGLTPATLQVRIHRMTKAGVKGLKPKRFISRKNTINVTELNTLVTSLSKSSK